MNRGQRTEKRKSWAGICESQKRDIRERPMNYHNLMHAATRLREDAMKGLLMRVGGASSFRGYINYAEGVLK